MSSSAIPSSCSRRLPRFLALKDHSRLYLQIDNVEGQAGAYSYEVTTDRPGDYRRACAWDDQLAAAERTSLSVPLIGTGVGTASINFKCTGRNSPPSALSRSMSKPVHRASNRRIVRRIAPGDSVLVSKDLTAEFLPGTGRVSAGRREPLRHRRGRALAIARGLSVRMLRAAREPHHAAALCRQARRSEGAPLSIRALPIASIARLRFCWRGRIRAAPSGSGRPTMRATNGSTLSSLDFLTRAREEGYDVPQQAYAQALERLRNFVANTSDVEAGQSSGLAMRSMCLRATASRVMGRSALSRRRAAAGLHDAIGAGADRRRARLARRPGPGGESLRCGER